MLLNASQLSPGRIMEYSIVHWTATIGIDRLGHVLHSRAGALKTKQLYALPLYSPEVMSSFFFAIASLDLRRAPVLMWSTPLCTALSIS